MRWSLRFKLFVLTACCVGACLLGSAIRRADHQRRLHERIVESGGEVIYDFAECGNRNWKNELARYAGKDMAGSFESVVLRQCSGSDLRELLADLETVQRLQTLWVHSSH